MPPRNLVIMSCVSAFLFAFFTVAAAAQEHYWDVYVSNLGGVWQVGMNDGQPTFREIVVFKPTDLVLHDGTKSPPGPQPDPPPDQPSTLRRRVTTAVRAANDKANASQLQSLYQITVAMIDAGTPLLSVVTIAQSGEARILDTVQERSAWAAYLLITRSVYEAKPVVTSQSIRDVANGINDATTANNQLYFLEPKP